MLVLSLLSHQLSRAWQLLQLVRTEDIPAHGCARHRRDTHDVYTHAIHELITSPVHPPCATHALARVEKRTSKLWTTPSNGTDAVFFSVHHVLRAAGNLLDDTATRGSRTFQGPRTPVKVLKKRRARH
jgi:hypothetical protein